MHLVCTVRYRPCRVVVSALRPDCRRTPARLSTQSSTSDAPMTTHYSTCPTIKRQKTIKKYLKRTHTQAQARDNTRRTLRDTQRPALLTDEAFTTRDAGLTSWLMLMLLQLLHTSSRTQPSPMRHRSRGTVPMPRLHVQTHRTPSFDCPKTLHERSPRNALHRCCRVSRQSSHEPSCAPAAPTAHAASPSSDDEGSAAR